MSEKKKTSDSRPKKAIDHAKNQIGILEDTVSRQSGKISKLEKENENLKNEVERLKKELSAKRETPRWAKANKTEDAIKKAKKKGPKKGHVAHGRRPVPAVTDFAIVVPEFCPVSLKALPFPSASKWHTHTQIDLPEPQKLVVTQYLVGSSYCAGCKMYHSAGGRMSGSLYGPRLHAQVCYWKFGLGMTLPKIQKMLLDSYALEMSTGQLSELLSRSSSKFEDTYADLKTSLRDQTDLNADETGWRVGGKSTWLWSFSNKDLSFYSIESSRAQAVVEDILGDVFAGILCSDFYGAYYKIKCAKQKCWAHLLRDLHELQKKEPENLEVKYFASRMKNFFDRGKNLRETYSNDTIAGKKLKRLKNDTQKFVLRTFTHPTLKTLAKRIIKYRNEMYTFIPHNLEPTNNSAEREVRPAVLMRKTSYGNRSQQGKQNQAILMSVIRTAGKRNINFVNMAVELFSR